MHARVSNARNAKVTASMDGKRRERDVPVCCAR
jgi:hypothetical protein